LTPELTKSKPKSLTSNAVWSIFLTIWQTGVTFILTPLLVAKIGTDHYGLFVLLMTISGFMGIMNLGLGDATLRFVAHYYGKNDLEGINRVVSATFSVFILTGFLAWALLFWGAPTMVGLLSVAPAEKSLTVNLLQLVSISVGLGFVGSAFSSIPRALQRYDISSRVQVAQSIFQAGGTVTILILSPGIHELVLWSVATALFTQILNVVIAKRLIPRIRLWPSPNRRGLKEVFGYGIYSFINHVLILVWGQADRLILGALVSPAAVAYLSVPQQLSFRGSMAVGSAGAALFPKFSAMSEHDQKEKIFLDSTWVLLCATIIIFVPLTALFPDFLRLWINPEFAKKSAWIGQVIAFGFIVRGASVPYASLFQGIGKPQYLSALFFATALTSLFMNLMLIPRFGLSGAGYAYLATTFWGFFAIWFAWTRVLSEKSMRPLLRAVVVPIALGYMALAVLVLLRARCPDPGWLGFSGMGLFAVIFTATVIFCAELLLGGKMSRVSILSNILFKFRLLNRSQIDSQEMP
jgi:O-antigen/teichoic acid export membrane protein